MTDPLPVTDEQLLHLIATEAMTGDKKLERSSTLEELGIESLDVMTILFEVEDKYGVVVEPTELGDCKTMGDILDVFKARIAQKA